MKKFLASLVGAALLGLPAASASASEDNLPVRPCSLGNREVGVIVGSTNGPVYFYGCVPI